jgi:hypothetical protein
MKLDLHVDESFGRSIVPSRFAMNFAETIGRYRPLRGRHIASVSFIFQDVPHSAGFEMSVH